MVVIVISWLWVRMDLGFVWVKTCHALKYNDKKRMALSKVHWLMVEEDTCSAQNPKDKKFLWVILVRK